MKKTAACLSEAKLADYLLNQLPSAEKEALSEHIADCRRCLDLLDQAYSGNKIFDRIKDGPPPDVIKKAKDIAKMKTNLKKHRSATLVYPAASGLAFFLSFVLPKYFLQFLFLALILGLKWVFETGSMRLLVMIYQAWRKPDSSPANEIAEDLKNRFESKR